MNAGCQREKRSPVGSPRHGGVDHAGSLETAKWRCDEHGPERVWISSAAPRHAERSLEVVAQRQDFVVKMGQETIGEVLQRQVRPAIEFASGEEDQ